MKDDISANRKSKLGMWRVAGLAFLLVAIGITASVWHASKSLVREPRFVIENVGSGEVTSISVQETRRGGAVGNSVTSRIGRLRPGERAMFECGRDPRLVVEYTANGVEASYVSDTALGAGEVWVISLGEEGRPTARYGKPDEAIEEVDTGAKVAPIGPRRN